jgi:hypothetical protein
MPELIAALDAFVHERHRCGKLDAGLTDVDVWGTHTWGARCGRKGR